MEWEKKFKIEFGPVQNIYDPVTAIAIIFI